MILRKRTLFFYLLQFFLLSLFSYLIISKIVVKSFLLIESENLSHDVTRAKKALQNIVDNFHVKTKDWAAWDKTYEFVVDRNLDYQNANLNYETLKNMGIDMALYFNTKREIVFERAYNSKGDVIPAPTHFLALLNNNPQTLSQERPDSYEGGLFLVDKKPLFFVALPILTSKEKGPARGTLVFAKYFRTIDELQIRELTQLDLHLYANIDSIFLSLNDEEKAELVNKEELIAPIDEQWMTIYSLVKDYSGQPVMTFDIRASRDIFQHGRKALRTSFFCFSILFLLFAGITLIGAERLIISRLQALYTQLSLIQKQGDLSSRIAMEGGDEVFHVAEMINSLLNTTQNSFLALHAKEQRLIEARDNAETVSRLKSGFVANVGHEIRTPLNGIIGVTDLLLESQLSEQQKDYVSLLKLSGETLLSTINEILDFSKIEANKVHLSPIVCTIENEIKNTITMMQFRASAKQISLTYHVNSNVPAYVIIDPVRLGQILTNLLGNAVKFCRERGEIHLEVKAASVENDSVTLEMAVSDTGIGIPEEAQKRIFEPFSQADSSTSRCFGGTGLGLTIVRDLVHLMGGKVWLKSQVNKGTTFYFTVLSSVPNIESIAKEKSKKVEGSSHSSYDAVKSARILVAEDNPVNQLIITRFLSKNGIEHKVVADGDECLSAYEAEHFDLILMDCQMPNVDGYLATKKIRSLTDSEKNLVPIIAMTAHVGAEEKQKCLDAGMNGYLSKPLDKAALIKTMEQFLKPPKSVS